jgi:hypothetical protein
MAAIEAVLAEQKVRTRDLAGSVDTETCGKAVVEFPPVTKAIATFKQCLSLNLRSEGRTCRGALASEPRCRQRTSSSPG